MWDHVRLLRGVLLLLSLLTLSKLNVRQDQPTDCCSAAWLLPLLHSLVFTAGCLAAAVEAGVALETMHIAGICLAMLSALLMMLYFLRYRGRLRAVVLRLAALKNSSEAYRRPGELSTALLQSTVIVGLSAAAPIMSWAHFFGGGQFQHPHYLNPVLVPAALQTPGWFWVITGLQLLHDITFSAANAALDLLVVGLADAVSLLLERLSQRLFNDEELDKLRPTMDVEAMEGLEDKLAIMEVFLASPDVCVKDTAITGEKTTIKKRAQMVASAKILPAPEDATPSALSFSSREIRLRQLVAAHREVRQHASDAADLCSLPLLCQFTSVTAIMLLGVYVSIVRLQTGSSLTAINMAYVALMLLRLLIVCCAGSRLIQQGEQLHAALVDADWSEAQLSPAARLSLHLLLEKTRQPAAFHGWGLFTAQKTTMLSMLGFVLTYSVILMQMVH